VWVGLIAAPAAWAAHHQLGSSLNFTDCQRGNGGLAITIGLVALVVACGGGLLSWSAARGGGKSEKSERFIAGLGLMACGLFGLTIIVQMLAAAILPACFR
jgi:hypothetical protein